MTVVNSVVNWELAVFLASSSRRASSRLLAAADAAAAAMIDEYFLYPGIDFGGAAISLSYAELTVGGAQRNAVQTSKFHCAKKGLLLLGVVIAEACTFGRLTCQRYAKSAVAKA
jgi:hypothetical protein